MKKITVLIFMLFFCLGVRGQFVEGFESSNLPDLASDQWNLGTTGLGSNGIWGVFDNGVGLTQSWKVATGEAVVHSGNQAAFKDRENNGAAGNTARDYLATPLVTIPANGELRFWSRTGFLGNQGTLYKIMVAPASANQNDPDAYTTIQTFTEDEISATFNVYEEKVVSLTAYAGQSIYVAFVIEFTQPGAAQGGDRWLLDDVRIVPHCNEPTGAAAGTLTQTSATLTWVGSAPQYEIEIIPAADTPTGTGTVVTGNSYLATATQPAGVALTPSTNYKYYVRAICDGNVPSGWVGPINFATSSPGLTCDSPIQITSLPYMTSDNTANYSDSTDTAQPASCAGTTTNFMTGNDVFYAYTATETGAISITMTPGGTFSGIFVYDGCANVGVNCVAGVANSTNSVREIPSLNVIEGHTYIIVISTNATPQTVAYDLLIQKLNCAPPSGLSAVGEGPDSASLSWQNPGGATSWEVFVQTQGETIPTTSGTTTTTNTNYSVTTTQDGTPLTVGCYQYWVRADCGDGTFSPWAGPYQFCLNNCTSSCTYTFVLTDTFGDGWNGNTMAVIQGGQTVETLGTGFTTGGGPINVNVTLCDGPFQLFWNNGGSFAGEVRVSIKNSFGQTIFTMPTGLSPGTTVYNGVADCINPACLPPTNLVGTANGQTSATLTWTPSGPETSWAVIVVPAGSPAPTADTPGWQTANSTSFEWTGLTSGTAYSFYVRAICAAGESTIAGPGNFTTSVCDAADQCIYTFVMADTFGDGWNGNTMSVTQNGVVVATFGSTFTSGAGPVNVQVPICDDIPFSLVWNAGGSFANEVIVSIKNNFDQVIFVKPGGTGAQGTTLYTATPDCQTPACLPPTNLVGTGTGQTTATLTWTPAGPETSWAVIVVPAGSPAPTADTPGWETTNTTTFNWTGLESGTAYSFYVRALCDANESTIAGPSNFVTSVCDPENQCTYTFIMADTFGDGWNGNTMSVTQNGVVVATFGSTFTNGAGPINVEVPICDDIPFSLVWNNGGSFANEVIVSIRNNFNQVIFVKPGGTGSQGTTLFTSTPDCQSPLCLPPTGITLVSAGMTSATLSWTPGGTETAWQVIAVPAGSPAPTPDETGWTAAPTNPFTIEGLTAGTSYTFYVRSVCSEDDLSAWSAGFNFNTRICEVEDQCNYTFTLTDTFGDGWNGNTMSVIQNGITVAILGPTFTNGAGPVNIQVPMCHGVPFTLVWNNGGSFANEVSIKITDAFGSQIFNMPGSSGALQGTTLFSGTAECFPPTCPKPISLTATQITTTSALLGWTEDGTATMWEVFVVQQGAPAPGPDSVGTIANVNPILITGLLPGTQYSFYVRAICAEDDISIWSVVGHFSTLPANDECSGATFVPVNSNSTCNQQVIGTFAGATGSAVPIAPCTGNPNNDVWFQFVATNSYLNVAVSNVTGGADVNHAVYGGGCDGLTLLYCSDNNSSVANNLTVGNTYYVRVWTATAAASTATFNLCITTPSTCSNSPSVCESVVYTNTVGVTSLGTIGCLGSSPNPSFFTIQIVNSGPINFLLTQSSPGSPTPNLDVDYAAWGPFNSQEAVCNAIAGGQPPLTGLTTGCSFSAAPIENFNIPNAQAGQFYVILITNFSNQPGVISLTQTNAGQPGAGSTYCCEPANFSYTPAAYCKAGSANPIPVLSAGSIAGTFSAVPAGLVFVDTATGEIDLANSAAGTYMVTNTLPATDSCQERTFSFTITIQEPPVASLSYPEPVYCTSESGTIPVTFSGTTGGSFSASTPGLYIDPVTGTITPSLSNPGVYTVNYTMLSGGACLAEAPHTEIEIIGMPDVVDMPDVNQCGTYVLPSITVGQYYSQPGGQGEPIPAGTEITTDQTIYIFAGAGECTDEESFDITLIPAPDVEPIPNVVACEDYVLPALAVGDYYTGPGGTGTPLAVGTVIDTPQTIYVYATAGECSDEESFTVSFGSITADILPDVTACDSFVLPGLSEFNTYHTAPDGGGEVIAAGTAITQGQTVYVWAQNGSCTAGSQFVVTINQAPVVAEFDDVTACGSYVLPALMAGEYRTGPDGTGEVLAPGTEITATQTIYVWGSSGTEPNCTSQTDFLVTITPGLTLDPIADVTICDAYVLPALVTGNYFTGPGGTGDALAAGTEITQSMDIYVYAVQGTCTAQRQFHVTVVTTPAFVLSGGCQNNAYMIGFDVVDGSFDPSAATYEWTTTTGNLGSQDVHGQTVEALGDGDYTLTVTVGDCEWTQTFEAMGTTCVIQKGISVNGDGKNDYFDLEGQDVRRLDIFNRYGMRVFSKSDYTNQWHGQGDNGEDLPDGTYYYVIERRNGQGLSGWIYLNRAQ